MSYVYWILLFGAILFLQGGASSVTTTKPVKVGLTKADIDKIKLSPEGIEKVKTIHGNWHLHSVKALIAQLGKELIKKLDKDQKSEFLRCLDRIHDKKDLQQSAACLIDARDAYEELKAFRQQKRLRLQPSEFQQESIPTSSTFIPTIISSTLPTTSTYASSTTKFSHNRPYLRHYNVTKIQKPAKMKMIKLWRVQKKLRHLKNREFDDDYTIRQIAPLRKSFMIKRLDRKYKETLLKKHTKKYSERRMKLKLRRIRRDISYFEEKKKQKPIRKRIKIISRSRMPSMKAQSFSPVKRFARLVRSFINDNKMQDSMRWTNKYEQLVNVKKSLDERENSPGARVYNMRMYDLVLDKKKADPKGERELMPSIIKSAYKLMDVLDERKIEKKEDHNVKFLSPRFFSVMPERLETPGHLSPSIMPLYEDKNEEQILPIPKLMKSAGMGKEDREEILSTIMEIAGANTAVDEAMKVLDHFDIPGLKGQLSQVTSESMKHFDTLGKSLTTTQRRRLDKFGYTLMDAQQLDRFHTDTGLANNKDIVKAFDVYKRAPSRIDQKKLIWENIRELADHGGPHRRRKRQTVIKSPGGVTLLSVLSPTILAPYGFTFITGLAILGPTILSPSLFAPLVLNPAVLSPYILSPAIGMPFILSPYLLSPYILTPIVWAPFILNPYCLSPNILNPYLMSPLVLSPLCLCPDILSPQALGGAILSPGVASPSIMSKSYLMASVLSPTFLS